ncbi:hypothetical protein QVD17_34535 [Tagetes erecta]|uniref:Ubiquitin-like protease family profile domain-containing protein n=1 Tax=Tagetes erecta TaxID=13708 RepID=A0AAD8JXZ3_TARER|nr:hypothetical protein QVD17_34535 [Tagetes erecta]
MDTKNETGETCGKANDEYGVMEKQSIETLNVEGNKEDETESRELTERSETHDKDNCSHELPSFSLGMTPLGLENICNVEKGDALKSVMDTKNETGETCKSIDNSPIQNDIPKDNQDEGNNETDLDKQMFVETIEKVDLQDYCNEMPSFSLGLTPIEKGELQDKSVESEKCYIQIQHNTDNQKTGNNETDLGKQICAETLEKVDLQDYYNEMPSFSLGLTPLENVVGKQMCVENVDIPTGYTATSVDKDTEEYNTPITKIEDGREKSIREPNLTNPHKSPYVMRGVIINQAITKEEELVWNYLFKEEGMFYKLLNTNTEEQERNDKKKNKGVSTSSDDLRNLDGVEVTKQVMKCLKKEEYVSNVVIDAWVRVLNYQERFKAPESPRRLFCDTKVVVEWMLADVNCDETRRMTKFQANIQGALEAATVQDLLKIDMVFFTMLEQNHYYIVVFDLKNPAITVIDNLGSSNAIANPIDSPHFFEKDTPYKLKHMFVKYLNMVNHSKAGPLFSSKIQRLKIAWATTTNEVDCGIFVMRHMEKYMGPGDRLWSGFSSHGQKKKGQLNHLRKKYAHHLLLSKCNLLKTKIEIEALRK